MISVSYLKSKLDKKETIKKIDDSNASMIHVDLMDGVYVEQNNFTIEEVIDDLKDTHKPLDIHLMVKAPEQYISELALLKPEFITIHLNSTEDIISTINLIKDYNIKVGIAINPDENIELIDNYLNMIDYVLIMSVYPGLGGQKFITDVLEKIKYLDNKNVLIGIDGGINDNSVKFIKGLNIYNVISGSYICMSDNYNEKIDHLNKELKF